MVVTLFPARHLLWRPSIAHLRAAVYEENV